MLNINHDTQLAAVDLGSNSFRLEIGRVVDGQILRVDYLKEAVRQGGDLDEDRNLKPQAFERGLKCLARFGERLKDFPVEHVRAVATQTLREATNSEDFIRQAQKVLGYPIEIISGVEEARLIYQGVSRMLPQSDEKRLVVDIGGRSTEFILGQHFRATVTESLRLGSVGWSQKYFADGQFSERNFERAEIAAESIIDMIANRYVGKAEVAYGASGTVGAVADVLAGAGFAADRIERAQLEWLKQTLIKAKSPDRLNMEGLKDDRRAVIGGGLAVLTAVFDTLKIDTLMVANGALRHGVLYDMLNPEDVTEDLRTASIARLCKQFGVEMEHANNVSKMALYFYDAMLACDTQKPLLHWAALCHEIGWAISHTDCNKHGAYILDNTELMGFAQSELHTISLLVLGHQGKLRKLDADFDNQDLVCQLMALRLAVIFCHSRRMPSLKHLQLERHKQQFILALSTQWANQHPQTHYLLEEECLLWQKLGWQLEIRHT
ncbi:MULTISPECIES: exopolyphosphatase [unclassified Methylophilus]|uniref:Exopolyphosphatase n=1 Tax=Methylophilus glucosoxydans TaxID=752553 RepID=A0ABW3GEK2_9PROT|nr:MULTISPECIES: exopolyphosphatase [unclassified Methylophilus]MBF5040420.1 exopolyphosphatase [Methylophilus sp. 13]MDF0378370.1 exopolyphosphatase [Methylophilus sp. YYY-1]MDT7849833.1 exopolyphosphatase [Methylophilus sp. VKM B-3414]BEV07369.1 exopolyphosphatase [Methylophilus sp. DW102]